jgi:ubiquinone/menaquinone biosynthesis C-methylase UbiE
MSLRQVNMTYEPFSKEPEYIHANREFVSGLRLDGCRQILDLACGTGVMTELINEARSEIEAVVGLDISRESLLLARDIYQYSCCTDDPDPESKNATNTGKCPSMILVEGTADILPIKDVCVDAVIMGNSIHLIPDAIQLLSEVRRVLRPGCFFAFNSSFYAGTMPAGTEKFHHEWVKQALSYMTRKNQEMRAKGLPGIRRKRGTTHRAFVNRWPSIDDWVNLLDLNGFKIENINERTVLMNQRCFETIGAYAGLASVLFSGYPVKLASVALQETVRATLDEVKMDIVPRLWLEVTAVRK